MEVDEIGRKWVGCDCKNCIDENFNDCLELSRFELADGLYNNTVVVEKLEVTRPCDMTKDQDILLSKKVCSCP
jgi:hypothetical protein